MLCRIELACKPVVSVGDGFMVVGDDTSAARVKVYTNATVKPDDRIIKLSGVMHTQDSRPVIYADTGPAPYFDPQGPGGGVWVASPGSAAYAATLPDAGSPDSGHGVSLASVGVHSSSNGSWVYLTGQVVTYIGEYYSYSLFNGAWWVSVYNIQGADRTPGIRVWDWGGGPSHTGSIVDVMAKVYTVDGQRILGLPPTGEAGVDLDSPAHTSELTILAPGQGDSSPLPNIVPTGMNNKSLGGTGLGLDPGVTNGWGLYNVGNYVTVWGRVKDIEPYIFNSDIGYMMSRIVIDDGFHAVGEDQQGIAVFGTCQYDSENYVNVNDYVSVTGVSSAWKPSGSATTYPCIWTTNYAVNLGSTAATRQVVEYGTVSGMVKLYDMPNSQATVTVYCSCGRMETVQISRQTNGTGSATYTFTDVPKQVSVTGGLFPGTQYPQYIVTARCDGYKVRTYTRVVPDTPRNVYMVRLRKIYVRTDRTEIPSDGTFPATITATVVDADHNPVSGLTINFRTSAGEFPSSSAGSLDKYTSPVPTNSQGQATALLYGVPSDWENSHIVVEATDDSANTPPQSGDDNPTDDPYNYDWVRLHDQYGTPIDVMEIGTPAVSLALTPDPVEGSMSDSEETVTATLTVNGAAKGSEPVTFHTSVGTFQSTGTDTAQATTGVGGTASVVLVRPERATFAEGDVTASATVYNIPASAFVSAVWHGWALEVKVIPCWVLQGNPASVTPKLTLDGATPVSGQSITLTTDHGSFNPHDTGNLQRYTATTNSSGEISTTITVSQAPVTATIIGTTYAVPNNEDYKVTGSGTVRVLTSAPTTPCEIFFCLDCTGSMAAGGDHTATDSVEKFLSDLQGVGVIFKLGGVKFNEGSPDYIQLDPSNTQLASLGAFAGVASFISTWVNNDYGPDGGDPQELQLDALHIAAQDMNAHSTPGNPNRYIVLITDNIYHEHEGGSTVWKQDVVAELTNSGCKVYISLWEVDPANPQLVGPYEDLLVNTGEFDAPNQDTRFVEDMYPLDKLRVRILAGWPSD